MTLDLFWTTSNALLATVLLFGAFYLYASKYLVPHAWSNANTGFEPMKGSWDKAFVAGLVASVLVSVTAAATTGNSIVGFSTGIMAGLLGVAAYSDLETHRVPLALTRFMLAVAAAIAVASIGSLALGWAPDAGLSGAGIPSPDTQSLLLPVVRADDILMWILASLGITALFFFGFLKMPNNRLAMAMLFISYLAFAVGIYGIFSWLTTLPTTEPLWKASTLLLLLVVMLLLTGAADLFLGHGIGGADTAILHALAFAFAWWLSPYWLFVALLTAFALQLALHLLAKPLGLGVMREMKRGIFSTLWEKFKARREGREPTLTYFTRAVPFVPMLGAGTIGAILVYLGANG